ncbi:hypothetical protein FE634_03290 [Nocardioides dongxiaopingii]|nr:hypothetical protein FE634_03290 [Nocardioides sp. S-1144]
MVAAVLVAVALACAVAAIASGTWAVAAMGAGVAAVLGAVATRITHTEVADTRRAWARDRAEQARGYAALTETRTAEQALYVADTRGRITRHEATIARLETRLADAAAEATATRDELAAEQAKVLAVEKASADQVARLSSRLAEAEERAAMAIVRVAELEQELDVVRSELVAWETTGHGEDRKHA